MKNRFAKLAALTRGAAIVGMGIGAVACTKSEAPATEPLVPVHVNGPPMRDPAVADDDGGAAAGAGGVDAAAFRIRRHPVPNAMPGRFRRPDGGAPDGSIRSDDP